MSRLSPQDVYERLLKSDLILTLEGHIRFYLGDVSIVVKQKDVVGNVLQEWLEGWLKHNDIAYANNPNSQMPPDFFLNPADHTHDLLEVKAFNYEASPAFDIADFKSYQKEIIKEPWMLDTWYLIFGYTMNDQGIVTIKRIWLKKVWEICRPSSKWALNVQYKNGVIHKIRPAVWYSENKAIQYRTFECQEDYLAAIEDTVYANPDTRSEAVGWKKKMEENYYKFYGMKLQIPRWMDVMNKYIVEK